MKLIHSFLRNSLGNRNPNLVVTKIFFAVIAIMWSQYVSVMDSVAVTALLLFQLYVGTQYYFVLKKSLSTTLWEAIAIGGSTYFGVLGMTSVLLPRQGMLIMFLSAIPLLFLQRRLHSYRSEENSCHAGENFFQAEWLITTTVFGLSIFYSYFFFLFLCLVIAIKIQRNELIYEKFSKVSKKSQNIVFWLTLYIGLFVSRFIGGSQRPFYGLMAQLFRGTDDQIFSEQMAHSLVNFGVHENSAAIGSDIKYHWLSLGWSGLISQITRADPFVVTLHVIPIISYLMLSILIAHFVSTISERLSVSLLVTVSMFGFQIMGTQVGFIEVLNTSNILPFIWFLALLIVLRDAYKVLNFRIMVLIALLAMFCSLGKAPYALAIAVGSIFAFIYHALKNRIISIKMFLIQCCVGFPMLSVYLILIRGETYGSAFHFNWKALRSSFPSPLFVGNPNGIGFLISVLTLLSLAFVAAVFLYCQRNLEHESHDFSLLLAGVIFSGVFSILINADGSTIYFLSAAIFATILSSAYSLDLLIRSKILRFRPLIIAILLLGPISTLLLRVAKSNSGIFRENGYFSGLGILIQVGVPCCLIFLLSRIWFTDKYGRLLFGTAVACCTLFLANSSVVTERIYSQITASKIADRNAPDDEIEALQWLRTNSKLVDVLVTNRMLCKSSFVCDNADPNTGSSHLISAYSELRVVIEGPRFLAPAPYVNANTYPEWITERVTNSLQFIDHPNKDNYQTIRTYGTTFAYVLKEQTLNRSWTPWASIVFENNSVIILELSGSSTNRLSS